MSSINTIYTVKFCVEAPPQISFSCGTLYTPNSGSLSLLIAQSVIIFSNKLLKDKLELIAQQSKITLNIEDCEGKYYIPTKQYQSFFLALFRVQNENNVYISQTDLENTLIELKKENVLNDSYSDLIRGAIETTTPIMLEDYEKDTQNNRDTIKAVTLALYYKNLESNIGVNWLIKAKEYLGENKRLGKLINLKEFFQSFKAIKVKELFEKTQYQELWKAAAAGGTITSLDLDDVDYSFELASNLYCFIENCQSLNAIRLKSPVHNSNTHTLTLFIEALVHLIKKRASLTTVYVGGQYQNLIKEALKEKDQAKSHSSCLII